MVKKSYKITFDLKEGYSKQGKEHTLAFAEKVIKTWMDERLKAKYPVVGGFLQDGKLFFPSVNKHRNENITVSHSAIFFGELSSEEDMKRKGREVKSTLEDLALRIKEKLKQESVFIIYRDVHWCV